MDGYEIVGSFYIKENQPDLGSHIANAGYITPPGAFGKGVAIAVGDFHYLLQGSLHS